MNPCRGPSIAMLFLNTGRVTPTILADGAIDKYIIAVLRAAVTWDNSVLMVSDDGRSDALETV